MYTQFHPRSPNAHPRPGSPTRAVFAWWGGRLREPAEGRSSKMQKPGMSRVKITRRGRRPRLCVLNQISRGAQPPSAADTWVGQTPQPPDYSLLLRRLRSFSFLHLNSSYKQNTNLLYHHVSFSFNFIFIQLLFNKNSLLVDLFAGAFQAQSHVVKPQRGTWLKASIALSARSIGRNMDEKKVLRASAEHRWKSGPSGPRKML